MLETAPYPRAEARSFGAVSPHNKQETESIVSKLLNFIKIIKPDIKIDIIKKDEDDNKILECAVSSNANYILSYDNHLLNLKEFRGIKIIKPEDFFFLGLIK